ncbi:uncharacterized protein LOC114373195 [Glycine soja]|uniref:uncharacterized protein LOC114373195 n=1 Tax=Glycine soja TaxID=3848 RepID=UPI00103EC642|nr:uncharacterized protein LOC114373195 [Glycine soja]XP_040862782.1 uncharacterized protein LOC112998391 [Glycine max]
MTRPTEFMDVADSDFLGNKEFDEEDSEFETDFEKYFVYSTAKNRFFGRKRPLRVILGSGLSMLFCFFYTPSYMTCFESFICVSKITLNMLTWGMFGSPPPELSAFILPKGLLVSTAISVTVTLGAVSVLDCWITAATLIYIVSVILLIVPAIYEKHGDIIDILGEKALFELNNLYADLMKKFFGKSQHLQECFLD